LNTIKQCIMILALFSFLCLGLGTVQAAENATKYGGTYILASHGDATYLNPFFPGRTSDQNIIYNIHESLYRLNKSYEVEPVLAESYEVSGLSWIFHLKKGILFHDGEEFTAEDVKYTYEWAMDPKNGAETKSRMSHIDSIEILDDYTIKITTKEPYAPFMTSIANHRIVPKHYHEKMTAEEYNLHPMGTGPYMFKEWVPGDHVTLEAFKDYWQGRPYIDFLKMVPIPEPSATAISLETGNIHSIDWPLKPEDTLRIMNSGKFHVYRGQSLALNHYLMNHLNPFFQDKRVRQAMMYALSRKATVKHLMKGLAVVAHTNISPSLPWCEDEVKKYAYDPEKAKELLAEAGWKPGPDGILVNSKGERFEITCELLMGDQLRGSQAEMDSQLLKQVGIEMKLQYNEMGVWVEKMVSGAKGKWNYDLSLMNWTFSMQTDPDSTEYFTPGGNNNWINWTNPKMTELLEKGVTILDPEKRYEVYSQAQKIFAEEVPFLYIQFWSNVLFISKKVQGVPDRSEVTWPFKPVQDIKKYWIAGDE